MQTINLLSCCGLYGIYGFTMSSAYPDKKKYFVEEMKRIYTSNFNIPGGLFQVVLNHNQTKEHEPYLLDLGFIKPIDYTYNPSSGNRIAVYIIQVPVLKKNLSAYDQELKKKEELKKKPEEVKLAEKLLKLPSDEKPKKKSAFPRRKKVASNA